jgi:hypothetical protein
MAGLPLEGMVKSFLKILLGGLVLFIAVAMIQEWDYFSTAWFGDGEGGEVAAAQEGEQEAVAAVRTTLALLSHWYASNGDSRYADRMPVNDQVLDELQVDLEYLRRNQRVQEPRLQRFELLSSRPLGPDRQEVLSREFWIHRTFFIDGSGEADPPRSVILQGRYQVVRDPGGWRVVGWEMDPDTGVGSPDGR